MKYEIIFHSGKYECVDGIAHSYYQACKMKTKLTVQMYNIGERDFYYEIKKVKMED